MTMGSHHGTKGQEAAPGASGVLYKPHLVATDALQTVILGERLVDEDIVCCEQFLKAAG